MSTSEDFRVKINVIEPKPPTPSHNGVVMFVGRSKTKKLDIINISSKLDITTHIDDQDAKEVVWTENPFIFIPYTDKKDLQSQIDLATDKGKTLILSSHATAESALSIKFNGCVVFTTTDVKPWDDAKLTELALKQHTCVFVDPELEGKAFYSFISTITTFPRVGSFIGLKNRNFNSAFKTTGIQKLMVDNNFSYYFQPTQDPATECNDVYIGGKQAQVFYQYLAIEDVVKSTIYNFVVQKNPYTNESLHILESKLSKALLNLRDMGIIDSFKVNTPSVEQQSIKDKVKGIVYGYSINFDELYRVAQVNITIKGDL